jgi:hypothetical protein
MRAAHFVILSPANTALSYSKDEQAGLIPAAAAPPKKSSSLIAVLSGVWFGSSQEARSRVPSVALTLLDG